MPHTYQVSQLYRDIYSLLAGATQKGLPNEMIEAAALAAVDKCKSESDQKR